MNATAENIDGGPMDETAPYQAKDISDRASEQPTGNVLMSDSTFSQPAHGRYAFGSGARPLDGYTIKRAIGRGGFGEVYYATSDSGKEVALKLILRNLEIERRGVMQCMNLKCPNLLTIFDMKTNDAGDAFVVMEYVAGPSLAQVLRQHPNGLPTAEVRHWMKGLVEGVAYLHDHGVVHRDLKPANLFMEEGVVKIGDYGLAKLITASHGSDHSESIGTCHYMAPEIGSGKYNKPIDVYAVGVILYEMLTGRVPFEGETVNEVLMKHLTARPDLSKLPEAYRDIVARALAKAPDQRTARIYDLLLPEDAPKQPEIRVIGAGNTAPAGAVEEVHRIEAEEPVFYIGPDTVPPRQAGASLSDRLRDDWRQMRKPGANPRKAPQRPTRTPRFGRAASVEGDFDGRSPLYQPPAPPIRSGRARVAELTTSMLWAAVLIALFAWPAAKALRIDIHREPQQLAYFCGMGLLGTWVALIISKGLEDRDVDRVTRRIAATIGGTAVGAGSLLLARALELGSTPGPSSLTSDHALDPVYFGLLYAATSGWYGQTVTDRRRRFRLLPVIWTALMACLLTPIRPGMRLDGLFLALLLVITIQIVSPWSEQAARYAKYVRKSEKALRKTKAA